MSQKDTEPMSKQKNRGRWWKIPVWIVSVLILVMVLALAATQTGLFKNWVKNYAVGVINETIGGEVEVESLEGNLLSSISLMGVILRHQSDTLLTVKKISASYDLWALLDKRILLKSLTIDRPEVRLVQRNDTLWNIMEILPPDTATAESAFDYVIELNEATLNNGRIRIESPDTLIPKMIDSIQVLMAGEYSLVTQEFDLVKLSLQTNSPDFSLIDLGFKLRSTADSTRISDLILRSRKNRIEGSATIRHNDIRASTATLTSDSLDLGEFSYFMPALGIPEFPLVAFTANLREDSLIVSIAVSERAQRMNAEIGVTSPFALMADSTQDQVRYRLEGTFENLRPGYWLQDSSLEYDLSGSYLFAGRGIDPESLDVRYEVALDSGRVYGSGIQNARAAGEYRAGHFSTDASVKSDFGRLMISGSANDLLNSPSYSLDADVSSLNLAVLLANDSLKSDLNFRLELSGSGLEPEAIDASGILAVKHSRLMEHDVDTIFAEIAYRNEFLAVDTVIVAMPLVQLQLGGGLGMDRRGSINFEVKPNDIGALAEYFGTDTLAVSGAVRGSVEGSMTDFKAQLEPAFGNLVYNTIAIDTVYGAITLSVADTAVAGVSGEASAEGLSIGDYAANSLVLHGDRRDDTIAFDAVLSVTDETQVHLVSELLIDSLIALSPVELNIDLPSQTWNGRAKRFTMKPAEQAYVVDSLMLKTETAEDTAEQIISVNGEFSLMADENLNVEIRNLSLKGISELMQLEETMGGRMNLSSNLTGTAREPVLEAEIEVTKGNYGEYSFDRLSGIADYANDSLTMGFDLIATATDTFMVDAYFPVSLSMVDTGEVFSYDRQFSLTARAHHLPLASIKAFVPGIESASGYLAFEFNASNTFREPRATGHLTVQDAGVKIPEYGIDYSRIAVDVALDSNEIRINEMSAHRDDGLLEISGHLEYDSTIVSGEIRTTDFSLTADDFYATKHKDYEVQIDANTNVSGPLKSATFGGKITVLRSRIYVPAFAEDEDAAELSGEPPLLVQATRPSMTDSLATTRDGRDEGDNETEETSEMYENLRGRMQIEIPRNTWLRSPEMKIEISGSIEIVKAGPEPELFGSISVVRGHYDVFGKRFIVDEGVLNFQGGVEMNPAISIEAHHEFRTASREKKKLVIVATGTAEEPNLKFRLDGKEITEGDAASYLAFGRSLDQLTYGERSELSGTETENGGQGSLASGLLASVVSSQITRTLGSELSVDVFDVKAQSDWKAATFVVGKYITNDLFVSYERAVGDVEDDDIAQQVVTLEYELTRIIYLQLIEGDAKASGFDIIFKWDNQKAF